jgi:hypothetical protein
MSGGVGIHLGGTQATGGNPFSVVRQLLCELDCRAGLVIQPVPLPAMASNRKQPQLANAELETQKLQHPHWLGAVHPLGLGHAFALR